jgi:hypothetical protein
VRPRSMQWLHDPRRTKRCGPSIRLSLTMPALACGPGRRLLQGRGRLRIMQAAVVIRARNPTSLSVPIEVSTLSGDSRSPRSWSGFRPTVPED